MNMKWRYIRAFLAMLLICFFIGLYMEVEVSLLSWKYWLANLALWFSIELYVNFRISIFLGKIIKELEGENRVAIQNEINKSLRQNIESSVNKVV